MVAGPVPCLGAPAGNYPSRGAGKTSPGTAVSAFLGGADPSLLVYGGCAQAREETSVLQSLLGRIRVPHFCKLELDARNGQDLHVRFEAHHQDGRRLDYTGHYPGLLLPIKLVTDLKQWLGHASTQFWGRPDGGL